MVRTTGNELSTGAGDYTGYTATATGLEIKTTTDTVLISVYTPYVIRIEVLNQPVKAKDFSYAVVATPQKCDFKVSDSDSSLTLTTSALKLVIQKKPFRLAFYD